MINSELYDSEKIFGYDEVAGSGINRITSFARVLPGVFLAGVQKGGTSSLYNALIQHPQILPAKRKEIFYFGNPIYYANGISWYKQFFALWIYKKFYDLRQGINSISIDASTNTFDGPGAPSRIKKHIPDAKIIVILRNPVDRAYSHFLMSKQKGFEGAEFHQALNLEEQRLQNAVNYPMHRDNDSNAFQRLGYKSRGLYARYLKEWYRYFPREKILVLNSEEFLAAPQEVFVKVTAFLEINKPQNIRFEKMNVTPVHEDLDKGLRQELTDFFKPHNEELFELLGKKYDW